MVKRSGDVSENSESLDVLGSDSEEYIFIDAKPKNSVDALTEKIFGDITKASACKQMMIGGFSGWISGYLANKVGKIAAVGLASTVLMFQIARYNGFITVNWTKVQHAVTKARARARQSMISQRQSIMEKAETFYEENFFLATGFTGGFIFGFLW